MTEKIVRLDARGRVALGRIADAEYYSVEKAGDGTILLTPMVMRPVTGKGK